MLYFYCNYTTLSMIVLLFSFLIIGIYTIFAVTFYKAIKLVWQHLGYGYVIALVIGLLTLLMNNNSKEPNKQPYINIQFAKNREIIDLHTTEYTIEKNLFHHIDLNLGIGKIKGTDSLTVTSATAFMNGMHIGTDWKPADIYILPVLGTDSAKYLITAQVSSRWLIFAYDDISEYSGTVRLR